MGRWMANLLLQEGNRVILTGRNQSKLLEAKEQLGADIATNVEAVNQSDVILVSVSLDSFEDVIKEIAPYTHPAQIVIDITSIKERQVELMHRYIKSAPVLGIHPMFGPGAESIHGQNFVLTPTNSDETALAHKAQEYLEARGAHVAIMSPRQHDEMMAVVLGLSHFIGLVSADTLASCDNLDMLNSSSGTSYRLLLSLVKAVISEDPEFYASLQMNLHQVPEIQKLFTDRAEEWKQLVQKKDRAQFIERMNALKKRLGGIL